MASALDAVDRAIVDALRADGRLSMRALAERLHISRAGAYNRVRSLERAGVITGYTATIDPRRYGYGVSAYVNLRVAQQAWQLVCAQVESMPEVEYAALVSGETDIVLMVRARDIETLRDLVLTRLQAIPEILGTQTILIFDEHAGVGASAHAQPA